MELTKIVLATLQRYAVLFPDTEVLYLSVPKGDREERLTVLRSIIAMEEQGK